MKRLLNSILTACLGFIVFSAQAQDEGAVLLMIGDSITYGIPIVPRTLREPDDGLGDNFGPSIAELQKLLNDSRRPSLVLNWGLGGSTSVAGVSRIGDAIDISSAAHSAEQYFALIQYGTNDEGSMISTSTTKTNIRAMVNTARNRGVTPVLANLTPRSDENVSARNQVIAEVASEDSVAFVNHFATFTSFSNHFVLEEKFNSPGEFIYLHPNQAGYDKIAFNWFSQVMKNLIEQEPLPEPEPEPIPIITPIIGMLLGDEEL